MIYEDIKVGQIINAKRYNELATAKWHRDWDKAKASGRDWGQMPQLAFYGFYSPRTGEHRKDGFVCRTSHGSHWFKTKTLANEFVKTNLHIK